MERQKTYRSKAVKINKKLLKIQDLIIDQKSFIKEENQ